MSAVCQLIYSTNLVQRPIRRMHGGPAECVEPLLAEGWHHVYERVGIIERRGADFPIGLSVRGDDLNGCTSNRPAGNGTAAGNVDGAAPSLESSKPSDVGTWRTKCRMVVRRG